MKSVFLRTFFYPPLRFAALSPQGGEFALPPGLRPDSPQGENYSPFGGGGAKHRGRELFLSLFYHIFENKKTKK